MGRSGVLRVEICHIEERVIAKRFRSLAWLGLAWLAEFSCLVPPLSHVHAILWEHGCQVKSESEISPKLSITSSAPASKRAARDNACRAAAVSVDTENAKAYSLLMKPIRFTHHAKQQMEARRATEQEVKEAIVEGERRPAEKGRYETSKRFPFNQPHYGRRYAVKEVVPIFVEEKDEIVVITVYTFFSGKAETP